MAAVAAYDRSTDPHSTFKAQSFGGAVATKHHQLSFPAAPRAGCPQPSRSLPTPLRAPSCELGAQRSATPRRRAAHVPSPSSAAGPDLQSACPLGKGDGADSAATSSTSTTIESVKQLKWLDREVNAGRAPVGQLDPAAGAGDRPPLRSDLYLRSYSKQPRRRRRSVLHRLWLLATGSAAAGGGVLLSACGFGVLASCIRVGTVGTAVAASMGGTKLTICGTNQLRKLRNPDATPFAAGTASACWAQAVSAFVLATTVSRAAGLIESFSSAYLDLLAATQRYASAMVFRMNSRKVAIHAADQFDRAARSAIGEEAVATAERLFGGAVAAADEALERAGLQTSAAISSAEMRGLFCNMCLLTSSAYFATSAVLIAPFVGAMAAAAPLRRLVQRNYTRPLEVHRALAADYHRWLGSHRRGAVKQHAAHVLAALTQAGALILVTKSLGLCGEPLSSKPSVNLFGQTFCPDIVPAAPDKPSRMPRVWRWFFT